MGYAILPHYINSFPMKQSLFVAILSLAFCHQAFGQPNQVALSDTVFTPDGKNPEVEYYSIYDLNKVTRLSGRMFRGKKDGVEVTYNARKAIESIQEFHDDVADGVRLTFAANGTVEAEENYRHGLLEGQRILYRFGGVRKAVENYRNGKLEGKRIGYYDNGFIQEEALYENGEREGYTRWYNDKEQLIILYIYKKGVLDGLATTFRPENGRVESRGQYKEGKEDGEWTIYDPTGKLVETIMYDNGKKVKTTKNP